MTSPHHATLLRYGFLEESEHYYQRPADATHPVTHGIAGPRSGCFLWQRGRQLLQADVVTAAALEQVLQRVFGGTDTSTT